MAGITQALGALGTLGEDEAGREVWVADAGAAAAFGMVGSASLSPGLGQGAIIVWPHKLVIGNQGGKGVWTGKVHPNASTVRRARRLPA